MKRVCFYHSADKDGHCSGAIVANHFGLDNVKMIGWNYGDEFPWDEIDEETEVYMVDLSLQPFDKMLKLSEKSKELIWIDHHKSAIDDYRKVKPRAGFKVLLDTQFAACELVWKYFYPDEDLPSPVYLIGRYDIWEWENIEGAIEFQYGLHMYNTKPENQALWQKLLASGTMMVPQIVNQGETIIAYKKIQDAIHIKSAGFELEWEGYKFLAINEMFNNSQLFDSRFDPEVHDAMLTFGYRKGRWHFGLYSPKKMCESKGIDLGAVAKRFGGGGHPGAAGFNLPELPFELPVSAS